MASGIYEWAMRMRDAISHMGQVLHMWHDSCITCDMSRALRVTWLIHDSYIACDMTRTVRATWLVHHAWHDSCIYMRPAMYSCVWRDSYIYGTWRIHMLYNQTNSNVFFLRLSSARELESSLRCPARYTYNCFVSHSWMSHVLHMDESCPTHGRVMSNPLMRPVQRFEWKLWHIQMRHVSLYKWVMSHVRMSHVLLMNASRTEIRVAFAFTHTDASCQII